MIRAWGTALLAESDKPLDHRRPGVTQVGFAKIVIGTVIDHDQGWFLTGNAKSADMALGIEQ